MVFLQNLGQESEDGMHLTESNENRGYRVYGPFITFTLFRERLTIRRSYQFLSPIRTHPEIEYR